MCSDPDQSHVEEFKKKLDNFLADIPDQPTDPDLHRAAATNSLICQIPKYRRQKIARPTYVQSLNIGLVKLGTEECETCEAHLTQSIS